MPSEQQDVCRKRRTGVTLNIYMPIAVLALISVTGNFPWLKIKD